MPASQQLNSVGRSWNSSNMIYAVRYHADLFWVTEAVGRASIEDLLEVFSRDREGRAQSVIEVKL